MVVKREGKHLSQCCDVNKQVSGVQYTLLLLLPAVMWRGCKWEGMWVLLWVVWFYCSG